MMMTMMVLVLVLVVGLRTNRTVPRNRLRLVLNPTVLTNLGAGHGLCAMFDESSQWTIVLPAEGLGYELVVPFPAYGFASLVSHNERLQPKQPKGNKTGGKAVTCEQ